MTPIKALFISAILHQKRQKVNFEIKRGG